MGELLAFTAAVALMTWSIGVWIRWDIRRVNHEWATKTGRYANWPHGR